MLVLGPVFEVRRKWVLNAEDCEAPQILCHSCAGCGSGLRVGLVRFGGIGGDVPVEQVTGPRAVRGRDRGPDPPWSA